MSPELDEMLDYRTRRIQLMEEIELLDGASAEFDQELVSTRRTCLRYSSAPL